jgi:predicted ATPase/DNA-binding CsgD family transcriptional regulator
MPRPVALTGFVGRTGEIGEIARILGVHRLVTLTGAGGCGKTRLADRVVEEVAGSWPDGAGAVDLAEVADPELVPTTVARELGLSMEPGGVDATAVAVRLRGERLLLWLDTCEHVRDAVADLVEEVLVRCADVSVLATSREPLGVASEVVWRVPALRPPEAVQLFEDRAALVLPDFTVADRTTVEQVCASVDNLPLAIELAAPWVRALSLPQIRDGLIDSLRLLVGGSRSVPERHQTMTACIGWSHDLISGADRVLLRRLSVFAGPFTLDGVRAVAYGDGNPSFGEVLGDVTRLLDASLLVTSMHQGEVRYRMLDIVRQYAGAQLIVAREAEATTARHLRFHHELAVNAEAGMDHDQEHWRSVLTAHRADLHRAIRGAVGDAAPAGAHLCATMARHWLVTGDVAAGIRLLEEARDRFVGHTDASGHAGEAHRLRMALHAARSMLAMPAGDLDLVASEAAAGIRLGETAPPDRALARCRAMAALALFFTDFAASSREAATATRLGESTGDEFARDWACVVHAYALLTRGRNDEADSLARSTIVRARRRRDHFCGAFARGVGVYTELTRGRVAQAVLIGRRSLEMIDPLGEDFGSGTLAANTAHALALSGDLDGAMRLMTPVVRSLSTPDADPIGFMVPLGFIHLWRGDVDESLRWFRAGTARLDDRATDWTAARCIPGLVGALRRTGDAAEAAGWVDRGITILTDFDAPFELADLLDEQGRLAAADPARSRDLHLRAIALRRDRGIRLGNATSLEGLACAAAACGDLENAAYLDAAAQQARARMGHPRPPVDEAEHQRLLAGVASSGDPSVLELKHREGERADHELLVQALTRGRGPRRRGRGALGMLTAAETEVATLVSEGLTNLEIASRLFMSRGTVKAHLGHIYAKTGVPNRAALAALVHNAED